MGNSLDLVVFLTTTTTNDNRTAARTSLMDVELMLLSYAEARDQLTSWFLAT